MDSLLNISQFRHLMLLAILCFPGCNSLRYFSAYQKPTNNNKTSKPVKTTGVYLDTINFRAFYFYSCGLVKYCTNVKKIKNSPNIDLDLKESRDLLNEFSNFKAEDWGCFYIINDSLYIQKFDRLYQSAVKRSVQTQVGIISEDSSVEMLYEVNNWPFEYRKKYNFKENFSQPHVYKFFSTKLKPDSTAAWFLNKKWYQQGLHPSRR